MSMVYHVFFWFFGNGESTPLRLHCKHTLTQWILTDEFEKAYPNYLTQTPPRSGFIPITFFNQKKTDSFGLVPPHYNNDMNLYSGHLKTALNSQKVYYTPRVGAGISPEKYDLMEDTQDLRTAAKTGTLANLISQVFPVQMAEDQNETTCTFVTGTFLPLNPNFSCSLLTPYRSSCLLLFAEPSST